MAKKISIYDYIVSRNPNAVKSFFDENGIKYNRDTNIPNLLQRVITSAKKTNGFKKLFELHPDNRLLTHFVEEEKAAKVSVDAVEPTTDAEILPTTEKNSTFDSKTINFITGIGVTLAFIGVVVAIAKK